MSTSNNKKILIKKKTDNNIGIIGYIGENNWVHGRNNGSVKRAVQNRIIGELWSTLASSLTISTWVP